MKSEPWILRGKVKKAIDKRRRNGPAESIWKTKGKPESINHIVQQNPDHFTRATERSKEYKPRPHDKNFLLNSKQYSRDLKKGLGRKLHQDRGAGSEIDSEFPPEGTSWTKPPKSKPEDDRSHSWRDELPQRNETSGHVEEVTFVPKLGVTARGSADNNHDEYRDREGLGGEPEDGAAFLRYRGGETGITYNPSRYESRTVIVKKAKDIPRVVEDSEFICGSSAVEAAIASGKRKMYKLWTYEPKDGRLVPGAMKTTISKKSWIQDTTIPRGRTEDLSLLDAMSKGLPHNVSVSS